MKSRYLVILCLVCSGWVLYAQSDEPLIPISENNLSGFINLEGKVVIKPRFQSVDDFVDGIAPAREDGLFGYINSLGKFVIPPKYDYALPFQDGLGKVYIKGKPFFINKSGQTLFQHDFREIFQFEKRHVAFALADDEKYGLISRDGEIMIEPTFQEVGAFNDGLAVVEMHSEDGQERFIGVINEGGEFVVDFGNYDIIEDFRDGFAKVWREDGDVNGIINIDGELVLTFSDKMDLAYPRENFVSGTGIVEIVEELPNQDWAARTIKKALINGDGELFLFESPYVEEVTYFNHDRAFIRESDDKWSLVNKQGQVIKAKLPGGPLENHLESDKRRLPFQNGMEILESEDNNLFLIDTEGNQLSMKTFGRRVLEKRRRGDVLLYLQDVQSKEGHYVERWGFWDLKTGKMSHAKYERLLGFSSSGLVHVVKDGEVCIVDTEGRTIWTQRVKNGRNLPLNIDYMLDGYIYAMSPYKEGLEGFGGFSEKGDLPTPVGKQKFPANQLSVVVKPKEKGQFNFNVASIKAYIVNTSQDTAYFDVEDSRMEMILEAKDSEGQWRSIEFLPRGFCGNSYHKIYLAPNYHWSLDIPEYAGAFETKLRAKLVYKKDYKSSETFIIYSNEFDGNINPAQFWRRQGRTDNMPERGF